MSKLKIYVSGGSHLSGGKHRAERINSKLGEQPDVIFKENAENQPPERREMLLNWISTPLFIIVISYFLFKFLSFAERLGYSDSKIIDEFPESKVKDIDRHYQQHITNDRLIWAAAHYILGALVTLGIVQLLRLLEVQSLTFVAMFFLLVPVLVTLPFMIGTIRIRDYTMYHHIEEFALNNDEYDTACAIVGGHHEQEIEQLIRQSEHLELKE